MRGYPIELRERVVRAVQEREGSIEEVAEVFGVSPTFIYKLLRQEQETGTVAPKAHGGGVAPLVDEPKLELLRHLVQEQPDATLGELQERLAKQAQVKPSLPTVCRALQKLHLPRKKKRSYARERDPQQRKQFEREVHKRDARHFVFVDEMGANINLTRLYARAPGSQRVQEPLPRNTPANVSVAGALAAHKILATCSLEGAFDGEAFALFIEQMVAPRLHARDTVLMDNVSTHHSARVRSAIEAAGATLLYLPAYSPDLNPMDSCWSKIKNHLRQAKARTVELLHQAIGAAVRAVTPQDTRGWFTHSGYGFAFG